MRQNTNNKTLGGNSYQFISNSQNVIINDPCATYTWDFGDGTTYSRRGDQGGSTPPTHNYSQNNYPYTVTLNITGSCCISSYTVVIPSQTTCSAVLSVARDQTYGDKFYLTATNVIGSGLQYTWNLGNGYTTTTSTPTLEYTYNQTASFFITLTVSAGGCTYTTQTIKVKPRCDSYTNKSYSQDFYQQIDVNRYLEMTNWVSNFLFYHKYGVKSIHFERLNSNKPYKNRKINILGIGIDVDIMKLGNDCTIANNASKSMIYNYNKKSFAKSYSPTPNKKVNLWVGDMTTNHYMNDSGINFGTGNLIFQ